LLLDVIQVELLTLVSEEQLSAAGVELNVIDLAVMGDSSLDHVFGEVVDADRHHVHQISDHFGGFPPAELLVSIVESGGDHLRVDVFSSASPDDFINAILDDAQFASVENHADVRVAEIKFFVAGASPGELTHFARLHVAQKEG